MNAGAFDLHRLNPERPQVNTLMLGVMAALLPGTVLQIALLGIGTLANLLVAVTSALIMEALLLRLRRRPVKPALTDGSIVLAAWLLALSLPPSLPLWQVIIGVVAMTTLGKHLYGGLGCNPFNPAMVGYAVLVVSFPITMTAWQGSSGTAEENQTESATAWDGLTSATPLDRWRTETRSLVKSESPTATPPPEPDLTPSDGALPELMPLPAETTPPALDPTQLVFDSPWPWLNIAFLIGGMWMLWRGVIGWRIPVSLLLTLGSLHLAHGWLAGTPQPAVHAELLSGAAMLAAFFIATDPVSAPSAPHARIFYGIGIGVLIFVLREYSAWPEGVAFAVLLMNCTVPLLDRLSSSSVAHRR